LFEKVPALGVIYHLRWRATEIFDTAASPAATARALNAWIAEARESEQRPLTIAGDAGGVEIAIDVGFGVMMGKHFGVFATFLVQAEPAAFALLEIILDVHADNGADAGEAEEHDGAQGTVALVDRVVLAGILTQGAQRSIAGD
jgi:hypothetical protein